MQAGTTGVQAGTTGGQAGTMLASHSLNVTDLEKGKQDKEKEEEGEYWPVSHTSTPPPCQPAVCLSHRDLCLLARGGGQGRPGIH